ncbi:NACHT domain-containing protein [Streptomyces sp. NPDC005438]|uniref:NACHT domain-containing protein n=1 Tax=Streptomyces sp. NPDC005438 TaxID=3156880 RepID=UPI00339F2F33
MQPAVRLSSADIAPLIGRLLRARPLPVGEELIASQVAFRGANPTLDHAGLESLAAGMVELGASAGYPPPDERRAVGEQLARMLATMGELEVTDVQAVRDGAHAYARRLRAAAPGPERALTFRAASFHDSLLDNVCLHLLHHLTQRSAYIAEHLGERGHRIGQLVDLNDVAILRDPTPPSQDSEFEARYLRATARLHDQVTIYGIDLPNAPASWPLHATYLSLDAEVEPTQDGEQSMVAAEHALTSQERVLLRGAAGSGKTTLIQWLAVTTAEDRLPNRLAQLRGRIPFVLPVRRFARDGFPAPDELLSRVDHPLAEEAPEGWVIRVLTAGRGLLLVDGIDEAPEGERARLRDQLRRLLRIYSGNTCLVTSRPSAVDEGWLADEGFHELLLAPMNREQVMAFITAWHTAAAADQGDDHDQLPGYQERLLRSVRLFRELRQIATNPLMCGLICALNRDRFGVLPQGRKALYEAAMNMLLQRRDPEREVLHADDIDLEREQRQRLLQKLAYWSLDHGRPRLERERAVAILEESLRFLPAARRQGDGERILDHLVHRTGMLREQPYTAVEFTHRTFQDYLGAKEFVERGQYLSLVDHAHETEWEEVIRMATAHARPDECAAFLERLMAPCPQLSVRERKHRRLMAVACMDHAGELDPATREHVLRDTRFMVRPSDERGARGLGWVGPIVLELLPEAPEELPAEEAYRLAVTATRVQDDAAIDYLVRLRDHPSLRVRAELARPWRHFDTERYAEEIIAHLDPEGLYFPVSDEAELTALRKLGGRDRIQVIDELTPEQLVEGLVRERVTHLWLTADLGGAMEWLSAFPQLHTLRVSPRLDRVTGVPEGIRITYR